jgi:hypothetical protein
MANFTTVTKSHHHGFHILASPKRPCRSDILDGLFRVFEDAFACRQRHCFVRFDLHLPQDHTFSDPQEPLTRFLDSFVKNRRREGHDPRILWCREQDPGARSPHFHFACLFSARHTKFYMVHLRQAERLWKIALGPYARKGLVNYCNKDRYGNPQENGILLRVGDPDFERKLRKCIHWASYLAKAAKKGHAPPDTREWGCSQARAKGQRRPLAELCADL